MAAWFTKISPLTEKEEKLLKAIDEELSANKSPKDVLSPQSPSSTSVSTKFRFFENKENLQLLINSAKNNPDFLLELQTKHGEENLDTLVANKSPKEVIIIIKRFEYDEDKSKDKEIREYLRKNYRELRFYIIHMEVVNFTS